MRESEVPGLVQTHCTCKERKGQSKQQFEFTPYKFELVDFLNKTTASRLYLVVNMQRRSARAASEEQGEAAAPAMASTMAGVASTVVPEPTTRVVVPEPATKVDDAPTSTGALPVGAAEITPHEFSGEVTGLVEHFSQAAISADGGAAASDGGAAACAEGGTMLARGARCEMTGLMDALYNNGVLKRCTLTEFHEASGRWEVNPKPSPLNPKP